MRQAAAPSRRDHTSPANALDAYESALWDGAGLEFSLLAGMRNAL